ncbi:hypothetical protein K0M31_008186 [Melipona bicolor]|uniref:Uncharacterized protein n=1 Tax=Melipona bicolor TaxID=60889 RepID=A0AA40FR85_9HYME|nr:hypothetical protein K0M31_008186 [Melipona bicolor]
MCSINRLDFSTASCADFRSKAKEPRDQDSLERLLALGSPTDVIKVGSSWTRIDNRRDYSVDHPLIRFSVQCYRCFLYPPLIEQCRIRDFTVDEIPTSSRFLKLFTPGN